MISFRALVDVPGSAVVTNTCIHWLICVCCYDLLFEDVTPVVARVTCTCISALAFRGGVSSFSLLPRGMSVVPSDLKN